MSDIQQDIETLYEQDLKALKDHSRHHLPFYTDDPMVLRIVARIERLERERDELKARIEECEMHYQMRGEYAMELTRERDELRSQYDQACKLVADMHLAATGGVTGPKRGVVEDVADLRSERDELRERLEWREDGHDGIYCRDETIRLQDEQISKLRARLAAAEKVQS